MDECESVSAEPPAVSSGRSRRSDGPIKLGLIRVGLAMFTLSVVTACTSPVSNIDSAPAKTATAAASEKVTGPAQDLGPRLHASAKATQISSGVFIYEIAKNDALGAIAERFDICLSDLYSGNGSLSPGHEDEISIGQRITVEFVDGASVEGAEHSGYRCRNMP